MKLGKKDKARLWEKILYFVTIATLFAVVGSIAFNSDDIKDYYEAERRKHAAAETPFSDYLEGKGTKKSPYEISNVKDLEILRTQILSGVSTGGMYFEQKGNIDVSDIADWQPLGNEDLGFSGVYDGAGYAISGLNLAHERSSFFGYLDGATICNLKISDVKMSADRTAVFTNGSTESGSFSLINCLVSGVTIEYDWPQMYSIAAFVEDMSGGTLIGCYAANVPQWSYFVCKADKGGAGLYGCLYSNVFYKDQDIVNMSQAVMENNEFIDSGNQGDYIQRANENLQNLAEHNIIGEYNLLQADEEGNLRFRPDTVKISDTNRIQIFDAFVNDIVFYVIVTAAVIAFCVFLSRYKQYALSKTIVYGLLAVYAGITLVSGFQSYGKTIIAMLYDGRTNGQLKMFTDFFDCVVPGIDPYSREITKSISIYPPLVSLLFYLLGHYIPPEEMGNSITARSSQMGSVIFVLVTVALVVAMYNMVCAYKQGKKWERTAFFLLICTTYPFLDAIERGNVSLLAAILIAVFLYNYDSIYYWRRQLAFAALAVAAGIKIYPAVFGLILLFRRRYKDTINCLAYGVTLNLLPSVFFQTKMTSVMYMLINATNYVEGNSVVGGKIDLPHILKMPAELMGWPDETFKLAQKGIAVVCIVLTLIVVAASTLEYWKKYMLLALSILLFTSFSSFYYVPYTLAPLMMFLDGKDKRNGWTVLYALLFAGSYMTFMTNNKYPLQAFMPDQAVWHMTLVSGTFLYLFEVVLLLDGILSCIKNYQQKKRGEVWETKRTTFGIE